MAFLPIFITSLLLACISIVEVGLVSSMVGFLYDQRHHEKIYTINWNPPVDLRAMPLHLEANQGHTTNGAAGYGFVLGLAGIFVAWRQRRRDSRTPSALLRALAVGLMLETLLTLAALIYTFVVTYQTNDQPILESVARAAAASGSKYPQDDWTPENWFKSLRDLPLAKESLLSGWNSHIHLMEAWRWMLIPLFIVDIIALTTAVLFVLKQRRTARFEFVPQEEK